MKTPSVSLGAHFNNFIHDQVQTGRYRSANDVIRAGLRLLEDYNVKLHTLQGALIAGEEDPPVPFDSESFLKRMQQANHEQ